MKQAVMNHMAMQGTSGGAGGMSSMQGMNAGGMQNMVIPGSNVNPAVAMAIAGGADTETSDNTPGMVSVDGFGMMSAASVPMGAIDLQSTHSAQSPNTTNIVLLCVGISVASFLSGLFIASTCLKKKTSQFH